jgi:hypothetical protein
MGATVGDRTWCSAKEHRRLSAWAMSRLTLLRLSPLSHRHARTHTHT